MTETDTLIDLDLPEGFEWSLVEIFGHRSHYGRAIEEERFGAKMLRIDVPIDGNPERGWRTHYYGGAAVFSFTLTDKATVMARNRPYTPPSRAQLTFEDPLENGDDDDLEF